MIKINGENFYTSKTIHTFAAFFKNKYVSLLKIKTK